MFWVAAFLSIAWAFHYIAIRQHRSKHVFWTLVRQYPDLAQAWFEQDDCWQIFLTKPPGGYRTIVPEALFAGPFDIVVRDKASGNQQRAVVFCAHKELTASQAHFPRFIASVIGQYPMPKRTPMNWVLGSATTAALAVWLFTPSDRDRWIIRDGTPACKTESELEDIQTASPNGRRYEIESLVKKGACIVLFANERVRLEKLSTDGSRALTFTKQHPKPQWLVANDLRKTNPGWLALPWWPMVTIADKAKPMAAIAVHPKPAAAAERVPPLLSADGTCRDWAHALKHRYTDLCFAARQRLRRGQTTE